MPKAPRYGERYDRYEPEKYVCISVDDDYVAAIADRLTAIDFYWHTLSAKGGGLAYCGITLIPPSSHHAFIGVIEGDSHLSELKELLEKALDEDKWVIHYGL